MKTLRTAVHLVLLFGLGVMLRLPHFANSDALNSDHAVVALQARHILRGEWSWFLWGIGYQASFESILTALFFRVFGETGLSLMLVTFTGFYAVVVISYFLARAYVGDFKAFLISLFLVFASHPLLGATLYPPRQWCLVFAFASIWSIDHALRNRKTWGLFWGNVLLFLSLYIDFFSIPFLLPILAIGLFSVLHEKKQLTFYLVGLVVGASLLIATRALGPKGGPPLAIRFTLIWHNLKMLWNECLPELFSYGIPQSLSLGVKIARVFAVTLVAVTAIQGLKHLKTAARLYGIALGTMACALGGFLVSPLVWDVHAVRYLAPILWVLPLSLVPIVQELNVRQLFARVSPYFISVLIGLYASYGSAVSGLEIVQHGGGSGHAERALARYLRTRGVEAATANYWTSYRLSFLFSENPVVMPRDPGADRYPRYRDQLAKSKIVAHLFLPGDTDEEFVITRARELSAGNSISQTTFGDVRVLFVEKNKVLAANDVQ